MAREDIEKLLIAGGEDKHVRAKYNLPGTKDEFIALAAEDGYIFTEEELSSIIQESGDIFEKNGNPPQRSIWWT